MTEADERRDESPPDTPKKEDTRIADAINHLMANPELIGMIGRAMASARAEAPPTDAEEPPEAAPDAAERSEASPAASVSSMISSLAPMLTSLGSLPRGMSEEAEKRSALLRALKPYLSKERCEAIEQMITVSRISEILRGLDMTGR